MTNAIQTLLTVISVLNFKQNKCFLHRTQIVILKLAIVSCILRFDDLIVGCPYLYEKVKDNPRLGGAVYIYIGNGNMVSGMSLL